MDGIFHEKCEQMQQLHSNSQVSDNVANNAKEQSNSEKDSEEEEELNQ